MCVLQDLDGDGPEPSDWDKYAAEEYEILVAEETASEQLQEGSVLSGEYFLGILSFSEGF